MVIGIARAPQFSPNSVEKDREILETVVNRLHGVVVDETELDTSMTANHLFLNMGRLPQTTAWLKQRESEGARIVNSPCGVEACQRSKLDRLMRKYHLPVPDDRQTGGGWWVKRGDAAAQSSEDVVYCADETALKIAKQRFSELGISDVVVQTHVKGDLVKFYGVEGTGFFRTFYPGDDNMTKFGDEQHNGRPHHYFYQKEHLRATVEMLSRLTKTPVYGGDAVITADGEFRLIDFNDWPSFSRCRDEAADAIVRLVMCL